MSYKKLIEVSDISKETPKYFEGKKRYYATKGINNEGDYNYKLIEFSKKPSRANLYPSLNDIGIAKMKLTNKVFLVDKELVGSIFSTGFMFIKANEKLMTRYLYWFCLSDSFQKQKDNFSGDGIMASFRTSDFNKINIFAPSLNEQKRIVEKLDTCMEQIDKAIKNVEQNIQNAEELFQSYLNKILLAENDGWLMTSIGKVANIVNGGTPKTSIMDYWSGDILWITPKDMGKLDSIYISDTSRKITELGLKKSSAKLLPKNSIILSSRAPIGHLAINTEPISTNQGCKGIVPGEQIESKFLYYFLLCNVKLLNDLGVGTTFKELSMSKLSNIEISLPERDIQQKIINEIDGIKIQTEQLKNNYQNELISLKELKQSILEKAFNGEL